MSGRRLSLSEALPHSLSLVAASANNAVIAGLIFQGRNRLGEECRAPGGPPRRRQSAGCSGV